MACRCGRHRTASGCAGARHLARRTPEQRRAHGREGGKATAVVHRVDILARYAHLDRSEAILAAWRDARRLQKWQRYRARHRPVGKAM
jgi:hypothetical protein